MYSHDSYMRTVIDDLRWSKGKNYSRKWARTRCFIDILPPFPTASGSIRHFRSGSWGCNIMEGYCARECKLGMHGSSEYSRRVNTRTLLGVREGDRYEEWYELCQARRAWRPLQGTNLSCRAQLVPEVPRMFYGDRGQWARFIVGRKYHERFPSDDGESNSSGLNLLNWLIAERKTF